MRRAFALLLLHASACGAFEFHPYELPSEEGINEEAIRSLEALHREGPFRFALIGDTQITYDAVADCVEDVRKRRVDFAIQVGDLTQFGSTQEFEWVHGLLSELGVPYLVTPGNHDLISGGKKIFRRMYGPANFSFEFAGTRFVFVDTNSREYEFPGDVPDLEWLESALQPSAKVQRTLVVSHVPPHNEDFDPALRVPFYDLLEEYEVAVSFHAHVHRYNAFTRGGVRYFVTDAVLHRNYLLVEVNRAGVHVERIFF